MRAILFRKLEVEGKIYYQLFSEVNDFEPDEDVDDYEHRGTNTYFYIDGDSDIEIPDPSLLNIYQEGENGLEVVNDSKEFLTAFNAFTDEFHVIIKQIKPIDEVVDTVGKKIMFQDTVIMQLVQRIYLNQSFVISDLPIELKKCQKPNILFHGTSGSGKKTIIKCLQKELSIPYVNLTLTGNVRESLETILKTLLDRSHRPEEASCGIVYIKDNFNELAEALGDEEAVYKIIKYLTSQGVITYNGQDVDFRTLTFVVLFNDDEHVMNFEEVRRLVDCDLELSTRELTNEEKFQVLFSENGCVTHYERFLNHYGNKFLIDGDCLMALIEKCSKINPSMEAVNKLINAIISYSTYNGIVDVVVDEENMEIFNAFIDQEIGAPVKTKEEKKEDIGKYLFEKKVDLVFNEAKKYFIGQDKQLKLFITNLLNNLTIAEEKGLYSPQSYKLNILIRGGTGTGKTFLVDTVCKLLNVPYVTIDTTKITETGYIGSSIDEIFISLIRAAGGNIEKAQKGIISLGEIDKKTDGNVEKSGPTRKAVLNELLKPIEGTTLRLNMGTTSAPEYVDFDTSRITFICEGAFDGIEEIRDKRIGKSSIGFGDSPMKKTSPDLDPRLDPKLDPNISKDDYIKYGVPSEFMGRVKSVIDLDELTKDSVLGIMNDSELSALKVAMHQFAIRDIELEFTDGFCDTIAKIAVARKEGVRGVGNILEDIFQKINHQDIRGSEVEKIIFNEDVILDPNKVVLVKRGKQKKLEI